MKKLIVILILSLVVGCKGPTNSNEKEINPLQSLVGTWKHNGENFVNGFQISPDSTIRYLGVHTSSGTLVLDNKLFAWLTDISADTIEIGFYQLNEYYRTQKSAYEINENYLSIQDSYEPYLYNTYEKSEIGDVVTDPVLAKLSFYWGTDPPYWYFINDSIAPSPTVKVVYNPSTQITNIKGYSNDDKIEIVINSFTGTGSYAIGKDTTATATIITGFGEEDFRVYSTLYFESHGVIIIDTYDADTKRCSGRFDYTMFDPDIGDSISVSFGIFDAPVYLNY